MKIFLTLLSFFMLLPFSATGEPSIAPLLYFYRTASSGTFAKKTAPLSPHTISVTVRFHETLDRSTMDTLERHGLIFKRNSSNEILHTTNIYLASVDLDSLETLMTFESIMRIENISHPARKSTLDNSAPLVQAPLMWETKINNNALDGTGIIVASVDTGIDLYHPAFFKNDGGTYSWIDVNKNNRFDPGLDAVDVNSNGVADQDETLDYIETPYHDQYNYNFYFNPADKYNPSLDWLYQDVNQNGRRDYGPEAGFDEQSPCFGERVFLTINKNDNNMLDLHDSLCGLSTSKVLASYDTGGPHFRNNDLLNSDTDLANHGTACFGILGGQYPGRRFTGMAPGVEFISINRRSMTDDDIPSAVLWAIENGADMVMYEFGSWVLEFLDGSSNLEIFISDLYLKGIPQFTASGNLAGPTRKKHAVITLEPDATDTLSFSVPKSYNITELYFSLLWTGYPTSMPSTTLVLPDGSSVPINATGEETIHGQYSILSGRDRSPNGTAKLDIVMSSDIPFSGEFTFALQNQRATTLELSAYLSDNKTAWMHGAQFSDHITDDGTITTPGTAMNSITTGSYDPRGYRDEKGSISDFSSWGKTIDGRRAVDITAPGFTIIAPSAYRDENNVSGGYMNFGGTSAALPHVVGCAALLMQAMPNITADELAETLYRSAQTDSYTGDVPNDIWGWGKLRVFDGLSVSYDVTRKPEPFFVSTAYPNPFNEATKFDLSIITGSQQPLKIDIYNILGQHIRTLHTGTVSQGSHTYIWDGSDSSGSPVSSGMYFFTFLRNGTKLTRSTLLLR